MNYNEYHRSFYNTAKKHPNILAWFGFGFGVYGASLLAFHNDFGWACFLMSNCWWMLYSVYTKNFPLLLQNLAFTVTSVIGVLNV